MLPSRGKHRYAAKEKRPGKPERFSRGDEIAQKFMEYWTPRTWT